MDVFWVFVFFNGGLLLCYFLQFYEFVLEGVVLFFIFNWFIGKFCLLGSVFGLFLVGYGIFCFFVEYVCELDVQLGLFGGFILMG